MSRFYDVLKQSGQIDPLADDAPEERAPVEAAPVAPSPVVETPSPLAAGPAEEAGDPWTMTHQGNGNRRPVFRRLSLGNETGIKLDKGARLLPNAAQPVVVEHYRRLRTKLVQQHAVEPFRSVVVTSANPQEGKTVTTLNLALSFAMIPSFRVLVVDGDLRRGSLSKWLGVTEAPGLSNLIDGSATLADAVLKSEETSLHFIVSGTSEKQAGELLHSTQLKNHFSNMADHFDLVLVDTPPVGAVADAHLLAAACDAVLVVARAFRTTRKDIEKTVQELQPFRIIGAVLNGGTRAHLYQRYSGYY